jgi:hypothetical protein
MKISKRQLKRIIKEEKRKLLNEGGVGIGFANWEVNRSPDFAKAYGKDARVLHDFGSNSARQNRLREQDLAHDAAAPYDPSVEGDAYFEAQSELEEAMLNAMYIAVEKGLIIDDLQDAWDSVIGRMEHELRV